MSTPGETHPGHQSRTLRVRAGEGPGALISVLEAAARTGAQLGDVRTVRSEPGHVVRDITVFFKSSTDLEAMCLRIGAMEGVDVLDILHDVLELRRGGVIET